jgi:hypothetical protein
MGARRTITGRAQGDFDLPADDLVTHGVVVGMTGSGKTGLVTVLVEEALRNEIPVLLLDIKGDLANLKLAFPSFDVKHLAPWVEAGRGDEDGIADKALVDEAAATRKRELTKWGITERDLAHYCSSTNVRVITPGSDAGEPLHLLSALERRSARWDGDLDNARATLEAAVSMTLRLMGRDPDPAQSRAHALLTAIAERRHREKMPADLGSLVPDVFTPPFSEIGVLPVETYMGEKARADLAADLNTLIASSSLARWRQGQDLDVGAWMKPSRGQTPATIVSVAHLQDDERALALGVVLEEALAWVRGLPGTGGSARSSCSTRSTASSRRTPAAPDEAPARRADEAGARLRRGLCARDAEPDGPRLPRAEQRRHLDARPPPDRRGPRPRHRGPRREEEAAPSTQARPTHRLPLVRGPLRRQQRPCP